MEKKKYLPYLFMLPAIISILLIYLVPFIYSIVISLTNWTGIGFDFDFVGLSNYIDIINDKNFFEVMRNTIVYFIELVGIQFVVSISLAELVNGKFRGSKFFKSVFFLPTVVCTVAVGFIWNVMFDSVNGPIKAFFESVGAETLANTYWLSNPQTAIHCVSFVSVWQWTGWSMVIYIAGMQAIDESLYEAASIDGANPFQKFFRITLPLLAPSITINLVNSTIGALKMFDLPFVMTGGGPGYATETMGMLMYNYTFSLNKVGYGAAIAILMFIIIMIVSFIQTVLLRKNEDRMM